MLHRGWDGKKGKFMRHNYADNELTEEEGEDELQSSAVHGEAAVPLQGVRSSMEQRSKCSLRRTQGRWMCLEGRCSLWRSPAGADSGRNCRP